jgi:4-amino-4-deoxy-L-arabinose transferase-like glycosyltransferase
VRSWFDDMLDDLRLSLTGPVGRWRAVRLARGLPAGALLVALCLAVYLPGAFRIPPVDRDEARFAQASRQMFESVALPEPERDTNDDGTGLHDGGLVVPMVQSKPRLNKPPLIYWTQTASAALFTAGDPTRDAIWMYRLPSALFATIAVLATWRLGARAFDPRTGFAGAALLAVCPMVVWDAHQARADQLLLACTTVSMWAMWESLHRAHTTARRAASNLDWVLPRSIWPALFWIGIGLGVLAKGPITPLVAALTLLAFCLKVRDWRHVRALAPALGLPIALALVLPWALAVIDRVGFETYREIVFGETVGRSGSAMEGHWGPPGYHLVLLVPLFWPGVLLTSISIARAAKRAHAVALQRPTTDDGDETVRVRPPVRVRALAFLRGILSRATGRRAELFCLCWILPSWIVFELIATKLPHYTLPLYPPIALLTARGLLTAAARALRGVDDGAAMLGHKVWLGVGAVVIAGLPLLIAVPFGGWAIKGAGALTAAVALWLLWRAWRRLTMNEFGGAQTLSVLSVVVAFAGTLGIVMPGADGLWIGPKLDALIREHDPDGSRPVAAVHYHEDSLVFLTRGRLDKIDDPRAWARRHARGLLIARPEDLDPTDLRGPGLTELGRVRGYNYSRGRLTDLVVYGVGP